MANSEGFTLRERQVVHRMAEKLWEAHGHPGQTCEPGSKGLGSCALDEQARRSNPAPAAAAPSTVRDIPDGI